MNFTVRPLVALGLLAAASSPALADGETVTTTADTLVVVTPNAPIVVNQGAPGAVPVGAAEMPPAAAPVAPIAPVVAANGAPQNESWDNVSHINGTPVKVGERSQYLYAFKKTNISGNPFGLFFGLYDISVARAVSQNFAVNGALTLLDVGSVTAYQLSATVPLYFRRTFSGPFLEGGLLVRGALGEVDCHSCMDTYAGPQLLFGWHWTFDSGLNVQMAFGVAKAVDDGSDEPDANGYFRVGYAF